MTDSVPALPWYQYAPRLIPNWLPGKTRVSRQFTRLVTRPGPVEIRAQGLRFAVPSMSEPVAQYLIWNGVYEPETAETIQRHLPADGTFVDVGANIGMFSLLAARLWAPEGRVLAIEASPPVHDWLMQNVRRNPAPHLTVRHAAVTNTSGQTVRFFNAPAEHFGMGALTDRFDGTVTPAEVPTITLDDAIAEAGLKRVDVIKVDVEGYELGVFQGAVRTLNQERPPVIIFEFQAWAENRPGEISPGDAQRFLVSQGYQLQTLSDFLRHGRKPGPVLEKWGADMIAWKA